MRKMFFIVLFAVASLFSSFSPALADGDAKAKCNSLNSLACEATHVKGNGLKPAIPDMVCFTFTQKEPEPVVFTLYDVMANPLDLNDPGNHVLRQETHDKDGVAGKFCVGHQFVEMAVFVSLCNKVKAHSNRDRPYLEEGLKSGTVAMCLNGDNSCPHFVN